MQRRSVTDAAAVLLAVFLLSLPAASQAAAQAADAVVYAPSQGDLDNACTAHGENCNVTGCCQDKDETCFAKDGEFATCLLECKPGVHEGDGSDFQSPWSCTTPDLWKCSKENENCAETACCQNPDLKCYTKNGNFSSCKASCEPGTHADDAPDFQTPWECTEVTQVCGEVFKQCGGTGWDGPTCCKEGCTCEVTSAYYHQCARTDVGVGDNDGSANTCSGGPAPPPQKADESSRGHSAKKHSAKKHSAKKHSAKKPAHTSSSESASPPLATVHAQVAGERAAPENSAKKPAHTTSSKSAPPPLATVHAQVAGEIAAPEKSKAAPKKSKASEDDSDDDWGDDDDDWDEDVDYAEQLPRGAAVVPAARRGGPVALTAGAGLGIALLLASAAAALVRGRWRSGRSHELLGVSEELLDMELE